MTTWKDFTDEAPRVSGVFRRRHAATGNLCLMGTLRSDGHPRISPIEPRMFEGQLVIGGMPGTTKLRDLGRDPRFTLHTATVDPHVAEGDAKLWGTVHHEPDEAVHARFADWLFADIGFDLRGQKFDHFYLADIGGASSVEIGDGGLEITIWKPGEPERVVRKG
ncbi:pyridoxamine 5'-phosphate oxidase family protein [Microlunatus speluncae]|uniref:pyridoxamine 5'-phosphate oxidase family protein n=1 Tax=Microlunatus speluncae TaxID=2594267 RepID=UPI001266185B|nr:pyridoxamine 5'-phosphate oxidase family protein [Microlunatus speluncae]